MKLQKGTATIIALLAIMLLSLITQPLLQQSNLFFELSLNRLKQYQKAWSAKTLLRYGIRIARMNWQQLHDSPEISTIMFPQWPLDGKKQGAGTVTIGTHAQGLVLEATIAFTETTMKASTIVYSKNAEGTLLYTKDWQLKEDSISH